MFEQIDKEILEQQKARDAAVAKLHELHAKRDAIAAEGEAHRLMASLSPDQVHALVKLHGLKAQAAMAPQPEKK